MKIKKIYILHEILTEQMNHWMLFPGALTVMGIVGRFSGQARPNIVLWALCGLYLPLFFLIRNLHKGFFSFLFLHLIIAVPAPAVLFFFGSNLTFYICAVCAAGYMLYSFFISINDDNPYTQPMHPVIGIALSAVSIMLLHYQDIEGWDFYYVAPLVGALALYGLIMYIQQYLEFLSVNERSAGHLPAAEMFRSGFMLVSGFVMISAIILLLCGNVGNYSSLWNMIKGRIRDFLRYLFSKLPQENVEQIPLEEAEMPIMDFQPQTGELGNISLIWRILEIAAIVLMWCGVALFLIYVATHLIRFLQNLFAPRGTRREKEHVYEPNLDVREKCGVERIPTKRRHLTEFLSPAQRIRRLYKKRILVSVQELTEGKPQKLSALTPKECGHRLEEEAMALIYEQVRYSDSEATTDTLRRMKNALRHKGHTAE